MLHLATTSLVNNKENNNNSNNNIPHRFLLSSTPASLKKEHRHFSSFLFFILPLKMVRFKVAKKPGVIKVRMPHWKKRHQSISRQLNASFVKRDISREMKMPSMLDQSSIRAFMISPAYLPSLGSFRNEIRHYQENKLLLLPKPAFARIVQEIFAGVTRSRNMNMHVSAVEALQEAAEHNTITELSSKP